MAASSARHSGSAMLIGLLIAGLVLVAVLTREAIEAGRSHRAVAERLLRDYAHLAADEMVRRSTAEVGYSGYYPLVIALQEAVAAGGDLPDRELLARSGPRAARALALARALFTSRAGTIGIEGRAGDALRSELGRLEPTPEESPYAVHHWEHGTMVYAPLREGDGVVGFEVELQELSAWFRTAFERGPLLPPSLIGEGGEEQLVVSITDVAGRQVFLAGSGEADPILSVDRPFGEAYGGIFEGLTVHVSLDRPAAERLVIGGLPASRLPLLLVLLLMTCGLFALALLQLRRTRALERMRTDFVSEVSHELRTPLTQIRIFAETLLLGRVRTPQEERRSLEIIDAEARRLGHLVENILQFSRGERGTIELEPRVQELAPVIDEVVGSFAPVAARRGVRLCAAHLETGARAAVDEEAMRQVLLNLLDNAVKYGPEGQEIRVGLESSSSCIRLWVDDEGPGIPSAERVRIWEAYGRLERDRKGAVSGTGIGLAVVRQLVELQGGRVAVEAGGRGGSRFVVELPDAGGAA